MNLVGNAIKFTERGRILVQVEVESRHGDEIVLHCSVSDSGIGIPKEKQAHVFDAFRQADGSTTRRFGGTGLGLSICVKLVELMGGRIWLESEPDQGSTFHFTVRLASPAPAAVPASIPSDAPPTRRVRVLLAEDNIVNQRVAVGLLRKQGHEVTVAANGREALALLEHNRFDLILMDVQMPEVDGFEATAAIRAREGREGGHIPIVAMTAHAMKGDRERCMNGGMDDYICKPIDPRTVLAMIQRFAAAPPASVTPGARSEGVAFAAAG